MQFKEQRVTLANTLMKSLEDIEEESGLFLIKPTLSWKGRSASTKNKAKVSVHQRLTIKKDLLQQVPSPSCRVSKPTVASSEISSSMPQIISLTKSYYEKLQDLPSHNNKNPGSVENYIKGLWKMQIDNPDSAAVCRTMLFTTPKLLEIEFKRNGIAQRNVSCKLPQLTLRDDGRMDLVYNKLQSDFTKKHASSLHAALPKNIQENEGTT
ncbi:uncharacterized protein LOC129695805 isoform X2 [Leucoraja erinacea]|uniref:uncharacterized protein LOC129695805 isoform X2 n=1 Tax=Leucoraja erinaceus TaxID=7782 RepID=UPI00245491C5|nr:uncharacterized protein LOC129695805 isoform X2 [Leucoraja erinacea]